MPDERRRRWPLVLLAALLVVSVGVSLAWPIYLSWRVSSYGLWHRITPDFTESGCGSYCWSVTASPYARYCGVHGGKPGTIGWEVRYAAVSADSPRWAKSVLDDLTQQHGGPGHVVLRQFGFPLPAIKWQWGIARNHELRRILEISTDDLAFDSNPRLPLPDFVRRCFVAVQWQAVAINSLVLWGILAALLLAFLRVTAWLRRRARERRFQCIKCCYPIVDGAPRCPECGREYDRPGAPATARPT